MAQYKIKQIQEDFIVKESIDTNSNGEGYFWYWLTKKNYTTMQALNYLSKKFSIPPIFFGFAGNKDKNAVTTQLISCKKKIDNFANDKINLSFHCNSEKQVYRGMNKGNDFIITVRNLTSICEINPIFINFFGEQRFSSKNIDLGRAIVKGDIKTANQLSSELFSREIFNVNKNIVRLLINSYQSFLWNKCVKEVICKKINATEFPIIGFSTTAEGATKEIIDKILKEEKISLRNFIIRSFPNLSQEGSSRAIYCKAENLKAAFFEDELNKEKKKAVLEFFLQKGSYATEFIRQNFQ